ncbi:DUF6783 domain-containing protein [Hungatella effluvii]|uniref:DUF6783 domain-containing protein n=1 Tax=Hungatella TaxID=1649459 RepID=UPI003D81123D
MRITLRFSQIVPKHAAHCDAQLTESNFQTRSGRKEPDHGLFKSAGTRHSLHRKSSGRRHQSRRRGCRGRILLLPLYPAVQCPAG